MTPDRNAIRAKVYARRIRARLAAVGDDLALFDDVMRREGRGIELLGDIGRDLSGPVVVAMYLHRVDPSKFRPALRLAWYWSAHSVAAASRDQGGLFMAMMRYAEFAIPESLGHTVTVWRGLCGAKIGAAGWSWTLHRDLACWVALGSGEPNRFGRACVLRREVRRSEIAAYINMSSMGEIIVDAPAAGEVDGDLADWRAGAKRITDREMRAYMTPEREEADAAEIEA